MDDQLDSLAAARARGELAKERWLALAGGALSEAEVASAMGCSIEAVEHLRTAGRLLGVPWDGVMIYPRAQFDDGGQPLDGIDRLLAAMNVSSPWAQLQELVVASGEPPESVLERLRREGVSALPALEVLVSMTGGPG